jgi:hypothetical protein
MFKLVMIFHSCHIIIQKIIISIFPIKKLIKNIHPKYKQIILLFYNLQYIIFLYIEL